MAHQALRRTQSKWKFSHALVALFIIGIMATGVLSMMRADSQTLDDQVASLQNEITICERNRRELEREAASMMSPKAIHAYAISKLGMSQVSIAGAVHVDGLNPCGDVMTASLAPSE